MKKETKIQLTGFEMLEKQVNQSGNSGRVYVPIEWIGKKVKIILIEKWNFKHFLEKRLFKNIAQKSKLTEKDAGEIVNKINQNMAKKFKGM